MGIFEDIDQNNLHHAYLIEGARERVLPEIFEFIRRMGIKTSGNPDFCHIFLDSFKMEDARNLKSLEYEKSFSQEKNSKKIFIISANNFLLEAQNALLKIFEEPIDNTHFFMIVPDKNILLGTLVSRFYIVSAKHLSRQGLDEEVQKFIAMSLKQRIDFIKELLSDEEKNEENDEENISLDSNKSKALKFLNALEVALHQTVSKVPFDTVIFQHIFKVREFINQPGSSVKNLMESVALIVDRSML